MQARVLAFVLVASAWVVSTAGQQAAPTAPQRPRLRDLGLSIGVVPPGPLDEITDVDGVRVGHRTVVEGERVRTGVTAILPHEENLFQRKVPAAVFVANGFGKAAGFLQVAELGTIETPIVLTNTLAVGTAVEAAILDSLVAATTVTGRDGHTAEAIPLEALVEVLRRFGRIE